MWTHTITEHCNKGPMYVATAQMVSVYKNEGNACLL